jgi:hypothetical protein
MVEGIFNAHPRVKGEVSRQGLTGDKRKIGDLRRTSPRSATKQHGGEGENKIIPIRLGINADEVLNVYLACDLLGNLTLERRDWRLP